MMHTSSQLVVQSFRRGSIRAALTDEHVDVRLPSDPGRIGARP
jgi:hypothetical protein